MNPENMQIEHHGVTVLLAFDDGEWLVLTRPTSTHWLSLDSFDPGITPTCAMCLEAERGKPIDPDRCDSVGWRVAAVPTPDGSSYWGFTSVPMAAVHWWRSLPLR